MKTLTWKSILAHEKQLPYFKNIFKYLITKKKSGTIIYPQKKDIFNALKLTQFNNVKVVIIGQDPYHGPNQANGLSFSVNYNVTPLPPSLINIYKSIQNDINSFIIPKHGHLKKWAHQGILLLNSILTVEQGKPRSHANIGWEIFTDKIITSISVHKEKIIFILWGKYAQRKIKIIKQKNKHYILTAPHPSPLSNQKEFLQCHHFSITNKILHKNKQNIINWQI